MRKVKSDVKTETAFDAFFDDENSDEKESLNFPNDEALLKLAADEKSSRFSSFLNVLKQIVLFLPGTFLLSLIGFVVAVIFLEIVLYGRRDLPDDYLLQFALIGALGIAGGLMTWFGLGDIKNKKHLVIPSSILLTGALFGAVVKIAAGFSAMADWILENFDHFAVYLLPLFLIVPVLAKGWVDAKTPGVQK